MRAARPHDAHGHPLDAARPTPIDAARHAAMGGLRTTAADYARFLVEIMAPSAPARFRLSEAIRREMVQPQVTVDADSSWALGWQVRMAPAGVVIQHQGGQRGVQAFAAASVARRTGFVILTDSDNGWKVFYDDAFKAAVDSELFA